MEDVAVLSREDTGTIVSSDGNGLFDISHVHCDNSKSVRPIENGHLIDEERGQGHGFDGSIIEPDCVGNSRFRVVVYFYKNKKGQKVAKYHYIPKNREGRTPNDPFQLMVIDGHKHLDTIGNGKFYAPPKGEFRAA